MKISILECPTWKTAVRINPFIKLLVKLNHSIFYTENIDDCLNSDLILIEYYYTDYRLYKDKLLNLGKRMKKNKESLSKLEV